MSFLLPNAPDSTGSPFDVLDQSEPDSLDFQILGNQGRNYVFSGGAVSTGTPANTTVAVTAATVVVDGVYYTTAANATFAVGSGPAGKRFDLVVVRVTGGVAALTVVTGANDSTNPVYPPSRQITLVTFDPTLHYDEATDVVLAALYRPGTASITSSRIVDKRVFHKVVVPNQGAATPTAGTATKGALYYKNNAAPGSSSSNLFVGGPDNNWTELSANPTTTGPYVPIGGLVGWPSIQPVPTGYLEASGQIVSRTTYSGLFSVYGTLHGAGDGSNTFGIPNYNGSTVGTGPVLKGTKSIVSSDVDAPGKAVGSDTRSLSVAELPPHQHTLSAHTHTVNHYHSGLTDNQNADHYHTGNTSFESNTHAHGPNAPDNQFLQQLVPDYANTAILFNQNGASTHGSTTTGPNIEKHTHPITTLSKQTSDHKHIFTTTTENPTSSPPVSPNDITSATGSGTAMSLVQASSYVRWIVRAL